ncbi:hypothetical protein A0256_14555 [Mucilaginibacter sp. PAMC 26640]|nr:hypothetical protein A0256_14555 [Mucilaginibacter sp. PAMC 26640]
MKMKPLIAILVALPLLGMLTMQPTLKKATESSYLHRPIQIHQLKLAGVNHHFGQGMNGHPDYTVDQIGSVIRMAKEIGLNSFRGDFNIDNNGKPSVNGDMFLKAAKASGMKNYVVLYIKGRGRMPDNGVGYSKDELNAAAKISYTSAKGFASTYPDVKYYQIDNELDVKAVGNTHKSLVNYTLNRYGLSQHDFGYNLITYPLLIVQIMAMIKGIKDATPQAKCGMNYAWRHAGLLQRINNDVPLDFVGIDAYNNEEFSNDEHGRPAHGRFVQLMKGDFPRVPEYFVSEMGFKPSRSKGLSASEHLPSLFKKYLSESNGVFLYEAINEPKARASSKDRDEAVLGLDTKTIRLLKNELKGK